MRQGFAVGEVITVALIFAILACILVPVGVGSVVERAEVVCQANLKQLGLASLLYAQDNAGKLPGSCGPRKDWGTKAICTPVQVYPYVDNWETFICPSHSQVLDFEGEDLVDWGYMGLRDPIEVSYGYNLYMRNGYRLEWIKQPAKRLMISEIQSRRGAYATAAWGGPASVHRGTGFDAPPEYYNLDVASDVIVAHNGGANIAFADGHVAWMKHEQFNRGGPPWDWWYVTWCERLTDIPR